MNSSWDNLLFEDLNLEMDRGCFLFLYQSKSKAHIMSLSYYVFYNCFPFQSPFSQKKPDNKNSLNNKLYAFKSAVHLIRSIPRKHK